MDHARLSCKQGFKRLHELGMGHAWFEKVNMGGEIAPFDLEEVDVGLVQRRDEAMPDVAGRACEKVATPRKAASKAGPASGLTRRRASSVIMFDLRGMVVDRGIAPRSTGA
jgi:hypothetical protein